MQIFNSLEEDLRLENQLCFPLYAVSRIITKAYKPFLDQLGITYPQYLVLLVLWENDGQFVSKIAERLYLNTNTVTPLLKRMEALELLERKRAQTDERKVVISLTNKGRNLKKNAIKIPDEIVSTICSETIHFEELKLMRENLKTILSKLTT